MFSGRLLRACIPLLAVLAQPAAAQGKAKLVADINRGPMDFLGHVSELKAANGRVFFSYPSQEHGYELWSTDGTPGGTAMVKDINPGQNGSNPGSMREMGGRIYFTATDTLHGTALWSSDGSPAGTSVVADVAIQDGFPPTPVASNATKLWFTAVPEESSNAGTGLWVTDGSPGGTRELNPIDSEGIRSTGEIGAAAMLGENLCFVANSNQIWSSDGTPEGTKQLFDFDTGGVIQLFATDTRWFAILGDENNKFSLWTGSDEVGSPVMLAASEEQVEDSYVQIIASTGSQIFFQKGSPGQAALWRSDGTSAGTIELRNKLTAKAAILGDTYYFTEADSNSLWLWKTDGTPQGTQQVKNLPVSGDAYISISGQDDSGFYFVLIETAVGSSTWFSNGTNQGTRPIDEFLGKHHPLSPGILLPYNGKLYFAYTSLDISDGLWVTDETRRGTRLLTRKEAGNGSGITYSRHDNKDAVASGGRLFFEAQSGRNGEELWVSNGKPGATRLVRDIRPGPENSSIHGLTPFRNGVIFGSSDNAYSSDLWISDGSKQGTRSLTNFPATYGVVSSGQFAIHRDLCYFNVYEGSDFTLWQSNGTPGGTTRVELPVGMDAYVDPENCASIGDTFVFLADDPVYGRELWRINSEGIGLLKDIRPGIYDSRPFGLTKVGERLSFFTDIPGLFSPALWTSDGTEDGTVQIASGFSVAAPGMAMGNLHLFFGSGPGSNGMPGWWRSDGTAQGTFELLRQTPFAGPPEYFPYVRHEAADENVMYFSWDDGIHGYELWKTDGTVAGTMMVTDIVPGPGNSNPEHLAIHRGQVYFAASDAVNGRNLWVSNGNASGTMRIPVAGNGQTDSNPFSITPADGRVFFSGLSPRRGHELHMLPAR